MLCANCQQSALNDDSPIFQVETDDSGYVSVVTDEDEKIPTDYYLRDELPELPSLSRSSHTLFTEGVNSVRFCEKAYYLTMSSTACK